MIGRDYLSWWLRPAFLRRGPKKSVLFAGPWVGEFGWELISWQAFVRALAPAYQEIVVSCRAGNEALYKDFATAFVPHGIKGVSNCNIVRDIDNPEEKQRIQAQIPRDADHLKPLGFQPFHRQLFIPFGTRKAELETDILFHPRGRAFGALRNWDASKWESLLSSPALQHLRIGCIGLKNATLDIEGDYADFRDAPLDRTMDLIASTRLVVGPSSGPMHLASLCKTPHLVWSNRQRWARGLTSREKYERAWNPFGTPAVVMDDEGFNPSVKRVATEISKYLSNGAR